jgi:hypothetical protein
MNISEIHKKLARYGFEYDKDETKNLTFRQNEELISFLIEHDINHEQRQNNVIISRDKLPYSYFEDTSEFYEEVDKEKIERNVIIQNYGKEKQTLVLENNQVYFNEELVENHLFQNALAYFEALHFFKNCYENENDGEFEFVDFYSDGKSTIIFSSLAEKKRLKLVYKPAGAIKLNPEVNYFEKITKFIESYNQENHHFHTFLKNSIISNTASHSGNKFESFFINLEKILSDAKLNFNVYLHGLSLEKIKNHYADYKQSYFKDQNEILSKISNQVIAFPFSIAAIAFSLSKLNGSNFPIGIIVLGIVGYVFYTSFLARILIIDLQKLNKGIVYDFEKLSNQTFFGEQEHKSELKHFTDIKNELVERIKKLKMGLFFFVSIVWFVSFGLVVYASKLIIKWSWSLDYIYHYLSILLTFGVVYLMTYKFLIICKKKTK